MDGLCRSSFSISEELLSLCPRNHRAFRALSRAAATDRKDGFRTAIAVTLFEQVQPRLRTLRAVPLDVAGELGRVRVAEHPDRVAVLVLERDAVRCRRAETLVLAEAGRLAFREVGAAIRAGLGECGNGLRLGLGVKLVEVKPLLALSVEDTEDQ